MAFTLVLVLQLVLVSLASAGLFEGTECTYDVTEKPGGEYEVEFHNKATFIYYRLYLNWNCYRANCGSYSVQHRNQIQRNPTSMLNKTWTLTESVEKRSVWNNKPFELRAYSCCWVDHYYWVAHMTVDLGRRSDTQKPNTCPRISSIPVLRTPQNCPRTYNFVSYDPDGDHVRYRYGRRSPECNRCNRPRGFVLNSVTNTLDYQNASTGIYAFELVVEDFPQQHIKLSYTDGTTTTRYPLYTSRKKRQLFRPMAGTTATPTTFTQWPATTMASARTATIPQAIPTTTLTTITTAPLTTTTTTPTTTTTAPPTTTTTTPTTTTPPTTTPPTTTTKTTTTPPTTTRTTFPQAVKTMIATRTTTTSPTTTTTPPTTTTTTTTPPPPTPPTTTTTPPTTTTTSPTTTTTPPTTTTTTITTTPPTTTTTPPTTTTTTTTPPPPTPPTTTTTPPTTTTTSPTTTTTPPPPTPPTITTTPPTTTTTPPTTTTTPLTTTTTPPTTTTTTTATTTRSTTWTTPPIYSVPISKLPLQFSFSVDPRASSCARGVYIPRFYPPTPENGAYIQAEVNKELEIRVKANASIAKVRDIFFNGVYNMTKRRNTNGMFVIAWTPGQQDLGRKLLVCFVVEAAHWGRQYQSDMRCVKLEVVESKVHVDVSCHESTMTVVVAKSSVARLHETHLQLSDPSNTECSLQRYSNSTHIIGNFSLNTCGTEIEEDETYLYFKNELTTNDNDGIPITRKHLFEVQFFCRYPKRGNVTQGFSGHRKNVTVWDEGFGEFTYVFEFFPTTRFLTMMDPNSYPLEYEVGTPIYMQIEAVSSVNNTVLFVETCRAAPYDNPNSKPSYTLIENGCVKDPTLTVLPASHPKQFRFTVLAFKFIGLHDQVFITCSLMICEAGNPNTRCAKGCISSGRGKREAALQSGIHHVSQGPLRLQRSLEGPESPVAILNMNLMFIAGCLLAAVGMICAVVMYKTKASKIKYQPLPVVEN